MSKFDENRVIGANKEMKYETFVSQYTQVLEHFYETREKRTRVSDEQREWMIQ